MPRGCESAACPTIRPKLTRAARDFIMAELVTKADLLAVRADLLAMKQELQTELRTSIETQTLRLTIRLGAMLVVAIGALATLLKLA